MSEQAAIFIWFGYIYKFCLSTNKILEWPTRFSASSFFHKSIPELKKNVLKNLWKHYCFINLRAYVKGQYFGLGIQIVSIFLYIVTSRRNGLQNCEYHIGPQPRKWGTRLCRNWFGFQVKLSSMYLLRTQRRTRRSVMLRRSSPMKLL